MALKLVLLHARNLWRLKWAPTSREIKQVYQGLGRSRENRSAFRSSARYISYSNTTEMASNTETVIVPVNEVTAFIGRCLGTLGTKPDHIKALADTLVTADLRGHYSHGLNRLEMYFNDLKSKSCVSDKEPEIIQETVSTALVEGNNLLGPVVGNYAMDLAIRKAKETGIGWVVARGSNHFGIAGWYSMRATNQGLLGFALTNSSPFVVPTRAKQAVLGTNPLSLAAPARNGEEFVLDMATSAVAVGKIEIQKRKGQPIPHGWAYDQEGQVTTNAEAAMKAAKLLPLGGPEEQSGYKGYGLCMMVEILCGILAGANYGHHIRRWGNTTDVANLGQCFAAIDPNAFAPGFEGRLSELMDHCHSLEPTDPENPVLVAGDPERQHVNKCNGLGGIPYPVNVIKAYDSLATTLNVKPIQTKA